MVRPIIIVCLVALAVAAYAQESDFDNDVIPHDKTQLRSFIKKSRYHQEFKEDDSPNSQSASDATTTQKIEVTSSKPSPPKQTNDFFSKLVDDIIQIPIAALRAVNTLLNNISQRNRHSAASNATASAKN